MGMLNECLILNVYISRWSAQRLDKDATAKVTSEANADSDSARVNKHLVSKQGLEAIKKAEGAIRRHLEANTLPWKDNGDRIIARKAYPRFMQEHGKLVDDFNSAVDKFVTVDYPRAVAQAEFRMGDMFKPEDYPSEDAVRDKFTVRMDIDPVQDAPEDFRVQMENRVNRSLGVVWRRLLEGVQRMSDTLASDKRFHKTMLTNLEELVDLIPEMNLTNDPELDRFASDVKSRLLAYDVTDLRDDNVLRDEAADEAAKIAEELKGFMAAFGGGK